MSRLIAGAALGALLLAGSAHAATRTYCAIGASYTAGTNGDPISRMATTLGTLTGDTITVTNRAVGGTGTLDWAPGGSYLPGALTACSGVTAWLIGGDLATNDAKTPAISAGTHKTRITAIVNAILATGKPVYFLSRPTHMITASGLWDSGVDAALAGYWAADLALVDGVNVYVADGGAAWAYSLISSGTFFAGDNVHPTTGANQVLGDYWAAGMLYPSTYGLSYVPMTAPTGYLGGFVRLPAAPGQVTGLTAGTASATTQALSWTAPGSGGAVATYTVEHRLAGSGGWSTDSSAVTGTSYTVSALTASTSYDYRVSGCNANGCGAVSSTVTASTSSARSLPTLACGSWNFWLDASNGGTLYADTAATTSQTTNGGAVQGWTDVYGSGRKVVQATSGTAPTLKVSTTTTGRNGLGFTGKQMASASGQSWADALRTGFTAVVVFRATDNASQHALVSGETSSNSSPNPATNLYQDAAGGANAVSINGSAVRTSGFQGTGTTTVLVARYVSGTLYVRQNGGSESSSAISTSATAYDQIALGYFAGLSWPVAGDLFEFAMAPCGGTAAETASVASQEVNYWGN